jgi:hypothetical protein
MNGAKGMHIGYWWESQKERTPLGRLRRRWKDNIKIDEMICTGLIWLRIETNGGLL